MKNKDEIKKPVEKNEVKKASDYCPLCRKEYDNIDYSFQICHHCGYVNK